VIQHKDELLRQIAAGLRENDRARIGAIAIVFETAAAEYTFGLAQALEALALDLFWDERGDWSDARAARVRVL
jgi:hypothetical protein